MTVRATILLLVFALIFAFIGLNWSEFSAASTLSFGIAVVQMPVGFVMLGFLFLVVGLFVIYVLYLQASEALRERRIVGELESQRKLADQAEASRIADLRAALERGLAQLAQQMQALEQSGRAALQSSDNALSAHLGEIEDRLNKLLPPTTPER
ncbi:MAG: LapA family protein [Rhodoferax sp.]|nr:LapA family protein [Rhodoferax sp.]